MFQTFIRCVLAASLLSLPAVHAQTVDYATMATDKLYQMAYSGDQKASFQIAQRMLRGNGVATDEKGAFNLFKQLADNGSLDAKLNVGRLYLQGKGTAQNIEKSKQYLKPVFETGDSRATFILANIAELTQQSKAIAYQLYQKVANDSSLAYGLRDAAQRKLFQLAPSVNQSDLKKADSLVSEWLGS